MAVPDIVGHTLNEARVILLKHDIIISQIKIAKPPRQISEEYDETYRVLRIEVLEDNNVELLICRPLNP